MDIAILPYMDSVILKHYKLPIILSNNMKVANLIVSHNMVKIRQYKDVTYSIKRTK